MRLPEGDSGLTKHTLNQERLDALSAWFALPSSEKRGDIPKDVAAMAKHFGVSAKFIEESKRRPEMAKRVKERLTMAAVYAVADILWTQIDIATDKDHRDCGKAARFVAEVAGVINRGGGINVNTTMITPMSDDIPDEVLITRMEEISRRRIPPRVEE